MPLSISLDELLAYSNEERDKWSRWFESHPEGLTFPMQAGGRYSTVAALIDHIFLVERRHLQRLMRQEPLADQTGVPERDAARLFAFGSQVRRDLTAFTRSLRDDEASALRQFTVVGGTHTMTPRKLIFHILFHETRHWAQIALAIRNGGLEPPGNHDLFYSHALA